MRTITAPAKINLALVVGPRRQDGKHEIVTVYDRLTLADTLSLEPADGLEVEGFPADTLVARALRSLADAAHVMPSWRIETRRFPSARGSGAAAPTRPLRCGS
jgi:4-diphosphocytidyl-2-C-methyl-D-erythritol kinase